MDNSDHAGEVLSKTPFHPQILYGYAKFILQVHSKGQYTRCDLYHTILFYYLTETKEIIYESVNLKRGCVQLITLCGQALRNIYTCVEVSLQLTD